MTRARFLQNMIGVASYSLISPWLVESLSLNNPSSILPVGSTVALVAPGSSINEQQFLNARQALQNLGYKTKYRNDILSKKGFLAGDDERRLNELETYLRDDEVAAIWAVRGGYGCSRLLPNLNLDLWRANQMPILGYSDLTALINYAHQISGAVHFHAAMPKNGFNTYTGGALKDVLQQGKQRIDLEPMEKDVLNFTDIKGKACGGNLTVMCSLVGTPYEIDITDKIVILEDIGERPYRIDRMLQQMNQSQDFSQAAGILLGQFTDCDSFKNNTTAYQTLYNFFEKKEIPVLFNLPFGHVEDQVCIPIGLELTVTKKMISWE